VPAMVGIGGTGSHKKLNSEAEIGNWFLLSIFQIVKLTIWVRKQILLV
jgi:hypothetical protein